MSILKATKRTGESSGQLNKLRSEGYIPAVLYGGKKTNLNISLKKIHLQDIIKTETFMSKVVDLDIDGNSEKVIPKDVAYDPVSDEPIHIDFIRIIKGSIFNLEIPVKFINSEKSPGLKKGGVLNIVRRKVQLKCPAENIPEEIVVDLDSTEIGTSIKISSVKLSEDIIPTIRDRDFVIATIAAPTIVVEPVKPAEETTDEAAASETDTASEATEEKSQEKEKSAKSSEDKPKTDNKTEDKGKPTNKDQTSKKK